MNGFIHMQNHNCIAIQDNKLGLEEQYKQSSSDVNLLLVLHVTILPLWSLISSI